MSVCAECLKPESDVDHEEKHWADDHAGAHPFVPGGVPAPVQMEKFRPVPLILRPDPLKEVRPMNSEERAAAPPVIRGDEQALFCAICGREKGKKHSGVRGHAFANSHAPIREHPTRRDIVERRSKRAKKVARVAKQIRAAAVSGEEKVRNVIELVKEIESLEQRLELAHGQLREMIA